MIEVFGHGGDMETAAAVFGRRATDFIDFSANINPLGPPPEVREALRNGLRAVIRYPDPGHRTLKSLLSRRLKLAPEWIGIGNGAAECMALVLLALAPARVGIVEPCFSEYGELAAKFGAEVSRVYGRASQQWRAETAEMIGLMEEVDLLFLGQPNNPNGVQYNQEELASLAAASARTGTVLVVDEAFTDFIPLEQRVSLLQSLERYPNVILIRSMTKFYAIPGLRLGYAVAHPGMIRRMTSKQVTWSVNGLALLAGEACLQTGSDYEERTLELVQTERERLLTGLAELGYAAIPGEANYLLVRAPGMWRASELQEVLGRRGMLIRSCAMYPGLTENHFRIAVKDRKDNLLLLETMGRVLEEERRDR
ncbi:threonine-phosphate decarboxylase CobD [Paenibacillus sp. P96]|uniref:threonine-phosphate decarboxylase n=1 Tax=Paenibacillus zeirhizosphaerae TaxID=2987519 RepID=A0ABT9FKQ0_9BACL|nr:threonine-phosphate decarboxylase CobD [Paenibacillus sp. P96]MDP4095305.1 threonine-phosphate decarboxylase CobD [Paenibacillus sp. P96]